MTVRDCGHHRPVKIVSIFQAIGSMDPVQVVAKLRKVYNTTVDTIGPANEPEKPKELVAPPCIVYMDHWERRITTINGNSVQCGSCLCGVAQILDCCGETSP